jgi:teichuronic acid biosynthesis protein TuaE
VGCGSGKATGALQRINAAWQEIRKEVKYINMKNKFAYATVAGAFLTSEFIYIDFVYFRLSLFRIGLLGLMLIFLIAFINGKNIALNNKNKFSVVFMILWFMYALISVLWVQDYFLWIRACWFVGCGVIACVLFSMWLKKATDFKKIFYVMSGAVIFHQTIGLYEVLTGNYIFVSERTIRLQVRNITAPISTMVNQNDYALMMVVGVFIFFICFKLSKNHLVKLLYGGGMMAGVILLYHTGSRANYIGFAMGFAFLIFMLYREQKTSLKIFIAAAGSAVLIISLPYIITATGQFINNRINFNFETASLNSENIRLNLILNGILFLIQTMGFGVGAGNIESWMSTSAVYSTADILTMHNWWAEILTAYGIVIFVLYLTFFMGLFVNFYKRYKKSENNEEKMISLGLMCIMIAFVVGSVSSSSNINKEWLWVFWAVAIAFQGFEVDLITKINKKIIKKYG